jgi:signal transduction histidine kinase
MVNDLFLIARFDSGKISLDREHIDLPKLAGEMIDFFQPMADEKKIKIKMDFCTSALLFADRTKLTQVLSNLLDNAIKFTPQNGEINVSLAAREEQIYLYIRDSGIGIPEEHLDKIFNRFYQVDQARSPEAGGAGLGLQICKRIIDAHGGSIEAGNNKDRGITVTVRLPASSK